MDLKSTYSKHKNIIWPLGVGLISVAVVVWVIFPQILTYLKTREKIGELQKRVMALETKSQALEKIDEGAVRQQLQVVITILPSEPNVPQALMILQDVIQKSELTVKSNSYSAPKKKTDKKIQLGLTVEGSIDSVRSFLVKLQETPRLFQVESISTKLTKDKQNESVETNIPLASFFEQQSSKTTLDQPAPVITEDENNLINRLTQYTQNGDSVSILDVDTSAIPLGKADPFE